MIYSEAISYITEALKFGINPGLEKIEAICRLLDNPQLKYPTIQITGTNGKTSTTWMLRRLLTASGLKTACYTSPHLHSYRERFTIDGEMIPKEDFAATLEAVKPAVDKVREGYGELTEFEILTAMAFYHFAKAQVDVAVFEVGLGGRWDATSVVQPRVAAITGVSLDHTDRLGETVEEIAWDKAHIIKSASVAVVGDVPQGAMDQIEDRCTTVGASLKRFGKDFSYKDVSILKNEGSRFSIKGMFGDYDEISLPVFGAYQVPNFTMAISILEAFIGKRISSEVIKNATSGLVCPGRFELVGNDPLVVIDGAHNPEGISMVATGLLRAFDYEKLLVVLAISSDKDIEKMLGILAGHTSLLVLSQNSSYRSASANQLTDIARSSVKRYIIEPDLEKALNLAVGSAGERDLVCITGSLYTIAEAREILLKKAVSSRPSLINS